MKNYQRLHYQNYYIQYSNGNCVTATRRECFAPPNLSGLNQPYPQRWFYDPEAGYAVRLARTSYGDALGKRNAADLKTEERRHARRSQCLWKGTNQCDQDCASCVRQRTRRVVELDKVWNNENNGSAEKYFDIPDKRINIEACYEDKQLLAALEAALDELTDQERQILHSHFYEGKTLRQIAADLGFRSHTSVVRRFEKALASLRENKLLKDFFE